MRPVLSSGYASPRVVCVVLDPGVTNGRPPVREIGRGGPGVELDPPVEPLPSSS